MKAIRWSGVIKKPRTAVSGFATFVKRHDRLLTVIGALVVFLGFFIKERFLAEAEDVKARLRAEQSTFELNTRLGAIESRLRSAGRSLAVLQDKSEHTDKLSVLQEFVRYEETSLADNQDNFGIVHALTLTLDSANAFKEQDDKATALLAETRKEARSMEDVCDPVINPGNSESVAICNGALRQIGKSNDSLAKLLRAYRTDVSGATQKELRAREASIEAMKNWTYLLFVIGWTLGLIGKIWKAAEDGDSSE